MAHVKCHKTWPPWKLSENFEHSGPRKLKQLFVGSNRKLVPWCFPAEVPPLSRSHHLNLGHCVGETCGSSISVRLQSTGTGEFMELRSFPGLFQFTNSICLGNVGGQGQKKGAEFHFDFWIETTEAVNTAENFGKACRALGNMCVSSQARHWACGLSGAEWILWDVPNPPIFQAAAKEVRQAGAVQPLLRALFTEEWLGFEVVFFV